MPAKKKGAQPRGRPTKKPDLSYILPDLHQYARPIDELQEDPKNARGHSAENIATIKASLEEFGQQKPVVLASDGKTVKAGNGTLIAARELGWTYLAAVTTNLDALKAAAYAIADNRSSDLASWQEDVLIETLELLHEKKAPIVGFDEGTLTTLLQRNREAVDESPVIRERYDVLVICENESQQKKLLEELTNEGYECRSLIS